MREVVLQPAGPDDCRSVWEWRNEPAARAASLSTEPVPYAEHERWFAQALGDPRTRILVARSPDGRRLGYVRFALGNGDAEISVALAPVARGRGLGPELIRLASTRICAAGETARVVARVRNSNLASLAAFRRAGFEVAAGDGDVVTLVRESLPGVLFCADASSERGLGHLQRSLALAAALEQRGHPAFFQAADPAVAEWIGRFGFGPERLAEGEPETAAERCACGAAVVDSYDIGAAGLARLREAGLFVTAIDDLARFAFPCHLVVNGGAGARRLPYRSASGDTRFLLGPEYALLRQELWALRERKPRPIVENVLVLAGGSDPTSLLPRLVEAAGGLPGKHSVMAVVGPLARNVGEVERAVATCGRPARLLRAPDSVLALLEEADLALTAAGGTLLELLAAGVPAVAYPVAENQAGNLRALLEAGAVARPEEAVLLVGDVERRRTLVAAGRRLVDGRGALRVAEVLEQAVLEQHVGDGAECR